MSKDTFLSLAKELYQKPFMDLLEEAHRVHRMHHDPLDIQKCTLLSIKTGGCPENCAYCPQSAHYDTHLERQSLIDLESVRVAVKEAKAQGSQRFCMGAAWRQVRNGPEFDQVLKMIGIVKEEGMESCVTLGMLSEQQAKRLREAGLDVYNHNLDTSPNYYPKIVQTRSYEDRLNTLKSVRQAGLSVCCGGIIGMGESPLDRCELLAELADMDPQPESVPINLLVPVEGTPLEDSSPVNSVDLVRTIAVARVLMPKTRVRLSAGRISLSPEAQILAFFAGANSIFLGEKLLTRPNPSEDADDALLRDLKSQVL